MNLLNLYCFLWRTCDHTFVYSAQACTLLMALIDIIRHEPMWAAFEFRALEDLLIHSDDRVQAPRMLGKHIFVYYI